MDEDSQGLIDKVFKVVGVVGVTPRDKEDSLLSTKRCVSSVVEQWRDEKPLREGLVV